MNKKATVTKELNAKHMKVLEWLLKLPENKECADCKSKAPRWASINLGIFICLQCSGIHRSLGVHISKVRSATLDTWLPEQVAFMQSMGNEKSNAHWEAELPLHYDRSRYDDFIRAKYVERKWVPRDEKIKTPPRSKEERASSRSSRSRSGSSIVESVNNESMERQDCSTVGKQEAGSSGGSNHRSSEVNKDSVDKQNHQDNKASENHPPSRDLNADPKSVSCGTPKEPSQVVPDPDSNKDVQNTEPAASTIQPSTVNATPVIPSPKVDYATELFRMLCTDDSTESDSSPSSDMSGWVDFDTDEDETCETKPGRVMQKSSACKVYPEPKLGDVQPSLVPAAKGLPGEYQKNATTDKQNFLPEPDQVMSATINPGQLSIPAQGVHNTKIAHYESQNSPKSIHKQRINGSVQLPLNGARSVKVPAGTQMPMLNVQPPKFSANAVAYTMSSLYRPVAPNNGVSATPIRKPPASLPVSGYDYDFSFLTQGMFTKR